jgi:hypothetical protein|mmetsp:Transcript_20682/g.33410  ORF Transcript_20682/g.33410 Transcript_20682/m.33410 type:complete len:308 (-) Transcript_20682:253-1176(-)
MDMALEKKIIRSFSGDLSETCSGDTCSGSNNGDLSEVCSGDTCSISCNGDLSEVDDSDTISLCSWTTDQGEWNDSQHGYPLHDSGMMMWQDWQSSSMPMWYSPGMLPVSNLCYYMMPVDECTYAQSQVERCDFAHHLEIYASEGQGSSLDCDSETSDPTTIILRNCPLECTRDMLLKILDDEGFRSGYDFIHLPIDFQTKVGLGYAIVNMVSPSVAMCAQQHFKGFCNWAFPCDNRVEVDWNRPHQGLKAHIDRYRNSPLMHESVPETYRPVLFQDGRRVPFPAPTARIRAPRIRHQKIKSDAVGSD